MEKLKLPQKIEELADTLSRPLFVVGGYVRNYLINKTLSADIDICGDFNVDEISNASQKIGFKIVATYKRTGTVVLSIGNLKCEYTSFRKEIYAEGGNHKPIAIEFTNDILLDAKRRDFKCNAVYYDIKNGKYLDVLGGIKDINDKILDTVIEPEKVFCSDGLRLMRLARFSSELGFTPTEKVVKVAKKYADNISDISAERIYTELKYILNADEKYSFSPKNAHYIGLKILSDIGVLGKIIPELELGRDMPQRKDYHNYDVLTHTLKSVLYASKSVRLASLLHDIGKPICMINNGKYHGHDMVGVEIAQKILNRLKVDNATIKEIKFLVGAHMKDLDCKMGENKVKKFIVKNYKLLPKLYALKQADFSACKDDLSTCPTIIKWKKIEKDMKRKGVPFSIKELKISATDLINLGYKGKDIHETLDKLLNLCIENPKLNVKEKLLHLI